MQKTVEDCLQQVWSVERGHARTANEAATIRHQDMGGVFIVERIDIATIGPAQGVPALPLNENLMSQAKILLQ